MSQPKCPYCGKAIDPIASGYGDGSVSYYQCGTAITWTHEAHRTATCKNNELQPSKNGSPDLYGGLDITKLT